MHYPRFVVLNLSRGLLGIILSLGPLSCDAMGWRGAGGGGASNTPAYIFNGGLFMFTAGILEFFLGNTFSFVVFCGFGELLNEERMH